MPKTPQDGSHYVRINIALVGSKTISVYAGQKILQALTEISHDLRLYHGVRLAQVLGAVYAQGRKDGARDVVDKLDDLKSTISYRNPGQPKKRKPATRKKKRK